MSLKGKTAVVTGGVSGIGLATARNFLKEGVANIALLDIADNQEVLQQLRTEFASAKVILLLTDIAKQEVVEKTFKKIIENFQHVDVVVNCAGVVCEQSLERTMNVNLIGLINVSMVALDVMSKMKGGNGGIIVNVSSIAGLVALPGAPFYNASKHGVIGFTRTMANDIYFEKHGVQFTAVCPGLTQTPLVQKGLNPDTWTEEGREYAKKMNGTAVGQTADDCGRNIATIAATTRNGAVWILDDGKIIDVPITEYWKPGQ